jgi:hypothetical protein
MYDKPLPFMALAAGAVLALVGAKSWVGHPAAQQWEYRIVTVVRAAESGADWSRWYEGTREARKELPAPVQPIVRMSELGDEGWELVDVVPVSNHLGGATTQGYGTRDMAGYTSQLTYYFKRPKS